MHTNSLRNLNKPWQRGISGNPKGRAKGSKNIITLTKAYSKFMKSNFKNGKTYQEYFVIHLFSKAISGDMRYMQIIFDICEDPNSDIDKQIYELTKKDIKEFTYEL